MLVFNQISVMNIDEKESREIKAVHRRLGYTGVKPDHEKAVRSFKKGWDVLVSFSTGSGKFECPSRFSLTLTEVFLSRDFVCWAFRTSNEDNHCNKLS